MLTIDNVLKCNIDDYSSLIELHKENVRLIEQKQCPKWLFRGVRNCNWGIKTSFDTHYPEKSLKNIAKMQKGTSDDVKKAFLKILDTQADHAKEETKQHYGVPTESLDWTEDLYVAIYFALTSFLTYSFEEHKNWYSALKYRRSGCYPRAGDEEENLWDSLHDEWEENGDIPAILVIKINNDLSDYLTSYRDDHLERMEAQKGWLMDLSSPETQETVGKKKHAIKLSVSQDMLALLFHELWEHEVTSLNLFQEEGMEKSVELRIAFETLFSISFFDKDKVFKKSNASTKLFSYARRNILVGRQDFSCPANIPGTIENLIKNYGESEILRGQ
ncbi:FRG domain-containing protein [Lacticaseibacillus paracasei]|uniref:FRG domain-containing protein n=1 Tax=Lacticaseibacillus paracasei TaxID=1597 RepID=UPI0035C6E134